MTTVWPFETNRKRNTKCIYRDRGQKADRNHGQSVKEHRHHTDTVLKDGKYSECCLLELNDSKYQFAQTLKVKIKGSSQEASHGPKWMGFCCKWPILSSGPNIVLFTYAFIWLPKASFQLKVFLANQFHKALKISWQKSSPDLQNVPRLLH